MIARKTYYSVTMWQDLCRHIKRGASIDVLLDMYAVLAPESRDMARLVCWTYRHQHGISHEDLLRGHGELFAAWRDGHSLESCCCLAALIARIHEYGGVA